MPQGDLNRGEQSVRNVGLGSHHPLLLDRKLYVDRAANQKGSSVGIVLVSPEKITIEKSLRLGFQP